jgi:hypothetical protein
LTSQRHQKWTQPYHPIAKKHAVWRIISLNKQRNGNGKNQCLCSPPTPVSKYPRGRGVLLMIIAEKRLQWIGVLVLAFSANFAEDL